jgi:serine protease
VTAPALSNRPFPFTGGVIKKALCLTVILALVLGFCLIVTPGTPAVSASGGGAPARVSFPQSDSEFVPGELIVRFRDVSASSAVEKLKRGIGAMSSEKLGVLNIEKVEFSGHSIEEALKLVQGSGVVVSASPNYIRHLHYTPDDPLFNNSGDPRYQWNFQQATGGVNMPAAWDIVQGGDPSVIVAVVDSGVAYENANGFQQAPDLTGTTFAQGYDFVNNTSFADDDNGHGTHVCGTIAQTTNNATGCAGIAFKCTIMPVKVMAQDGSGSDTNIIKGIAFAATNGAKVINMSIGGPDADPSLEDVINLSVAGGTTVCASTGNGNGSVGNPTPDYPAGFPACIAVGATRRDTGIASYSNYGDPLQVDAPGGDGSTGDFIYQQTYRQKEHPFGPAPIFAFVGYSGTSMACPHVAAEAALIRSLHPDWTVNDVRADITSTCRSIGSANLYGYGLIDIAAALAAPRPSFLFYFAEGTVRPNFETYLCIQNPNGAQAQVVITYLKGNGSSGQQQVDIPPNSRSTVRVKDALGEGDDTAHDFSSAVTCVNGLTIIAERPMYFNYSKVWTGGHDVMGATSPQASFYFAEGTCRPNFDPYICILNGGDAAADVTITYMKGDGTTTAKSLSVPKGTRSTVRAIDTLGVGNDPAHDFSAKVECTNGQLILAERPMYFNYLGASNFNWTGGHDVVGFTP